VKCYHGGGTFVWPLIQDFDYLSLEPIQIEIPLRGALSSENIRVNVPSVFTVAVGTTPEVMNNAAIRLLGLKRVDVEKQAQEIIFGQLRQVIASMRIEDINKDRDTFLTHILNSLEPELKKIGLILINVNITDLTDESGYIDAIGQKAASQAIQQARSAIHPCAECFGFAEGGLCPICRDTRRDASVLCVVEAPQDVDPIERSGAFRGRYHVLGGALSPLDGVDPEDLTIDQLVARVRAGGISEVIVATNPTMTGEATAAYIAGLLRSAVRVTRLASGLPVGGDLEFADEVTLGRAVEGRRLID